MIEVTFDLYQTSAQFARVSNAAVRSHPATVAIAGWMRKKGGAGIFPDRRLR
jgi:hypothetical protein